MGNFKEIVIAGYSGHALVVADILLKLGYKIKGYLDFREKEQNVLNIPYLGFEQEKRILHNLKGTPVFASIGDNKIREAVITLFEKENFQIPALVSLSANVSSLCKINYGSLVCNGACINPFAKIGKGVIINTASVIEHESVVSDFSHIAPGAILAGGAKIGKRSFVGANAVIKEGIKVGENIVIGAGTFINISIEEPGTYVGNPFKKIK